MKVESPEIIDQLVKRSQELVERSWKGDSPQEKPSLSALARSQIRNILEMALATDSFKALELFIRYQAGRKTISYKFAEDLTKELEEIQKKNGIEAIRLYLGYMYRYFVWKGSLKPGDTND